MATAMTVVSATTAARQHPHETMNQRGAMAMGFDQDKTTHHFSLFDDGGRIEVLVNDPADRKNLEAIRSHLPHIATMFGAGTFDVPMLVHDSTNVPGTATMAKLKDAIKYTYAETPRGGRVEIVTANTSAIAAVYEFLTFQIRDHKTGDSTVVSKRVK